MITTDHLSLIDGSGIALNNRQHSTMKIQNLFSSDKIYIEIFYVKAALRRLFGIIDMFVESRNKMILISLYYLLYSNRIIRTKVGNPLKHYFRPFRMTVVRMTNTDSRTFILHNNNRQTHIIITTM